MIVLHVGALNSFLAVVQEAYNVERKMTQQRVVRERAVLSQNFLTRAKIIPTNWFSRRKATIIGLLAFAAVMSLQLLFVMKSLGHAYVDGSWDVMLQDGFVGHLQLRLLVLPTISLLLVVMHIAAFQLPDPWDKVLAKNKDPKANDFYLWLVIQTQSEQRDTDIFGCTVKDRKDEGDRERPVTAWEITNMIRKIGDGRDKTNQEILALCQENLDHLKSRPWPSMQQLSSLQGLQGASPPAEEPLSAGYSLTSRRRRTVARRDDRLSSTRGEGGAMSFRISYGD